MSQAPRIDRRTALGHLVFAAAPTWLLACKGEATCLDVTGLSPDEVNTRNNVAAYIDRATDASKKCLACVQYVPGTPNACGGCKVVKGPIHPEGGCKLFVAKPA